MRLLKVKDGHKKQRIALEPIRSEEETAGYRSVYFKRPSGFVFEAGDWIDIQFEAGSLSGGITYSLSSSPTESDLRITFKEGLSEFKRALRAVTPNDRLFITQYGNDYDFQLKRHRASMLIAGGVGVAPFRSMVKQLYDEKANTDVSMVYLNKDDDFLFKSELDYFVDRIPGLDITFVSTKELNRKKREKLILSKIKRADWNFYVSGPPAMVEANEHLLLDNGVPLKNIRIDSFGGYE